MNTVNKDELEKTEAQKRSWEAGALKKTLDRAPERQEGFATTSGIPLERVYTPLDAADQDYGRDLGFPGEYPFTRGVQPTMYRGRFWTMRQYAGFGTAEEYNRRYQYLLQQGQTGLSVAFDLPTQMGYDSDHAMVAGEVGKVGVAVDSLEDVETLFRGIPLGKVVECVSRINTGAKYSDEVFQFSVGLNGIVTKRVERSACDIPRREEADKAEVETEVSGQPGAE